MTGVPSHLKTQQLALYAAERRVVDKGRQIVDVQAYVDQIVNQAWFGETYPMVPAIDVKLIPSGSGSVGGYDRAKRRGMMDMLPVHRVENYVLHELAHVLAEAKFESKSHDPFFARIYLELVFRLRGVNAWLDLKAEFDQDNICYDERTES